MKKVFKYAFMNSFGTALYVILVASSVFALQGFFSDVQTIFAPIAMLMLLVFSVAFVGTLIFGRPAMWYVDGKKKEALTLLIYTLVTFLIITIVFFGISVTIRAWG